MSEAVGVEVGLHGLLVGGLIDELLACRREAQADSLAEGCKRAGEEAGSAVQGRWEAASGALRTNGARRQFRSEISLTLDREVGDHGSHCGNNGCRRSHDCTGADGQRSGLSAVKAELVEENGRHCDLRGDGWMMQLGAAASALCGQKADAAGRQMQ